MRRTIGTAERARPRHSLAGPRGDATDAALVQGMRAGDELSFEAIYERHSAGILSFCRHMLGSIEDAEEAAQHTFLAAYDEVSKSDAEREFNLRPWLFTVARNRCLSMLRARREVASEDIEVEVNGLVEEVERRAELRRLVGDLQRLPERQRAALLLTELRDLSQDEVAQVLDCKVGQVKGLVFRARSSLIERRTAREAKCDEVRAELATATGGTFRKTAIRYHLEECDGCSNFLEEVRRQRRSLALALPVVPSATFHDSIFGSIESAAGAASVATGAAVTAVAAGSGAGAGVGAGAAGGAAAGGGLASLGAAAAGLLSSGTAKIAVVAVLGAGAAGVANEAVHQSGVPPVPREASTPAGDAARSPAAGEGAGAATGAATSRSDRPAGAARPDSAARSERARSPRGPNARREARIATGERSGSSAAGGSRPADGAPGTGSTGAAGTGAAPEGTPGSGISILPGASGRPRGEAGSRGNGAAGRTAGRGNSLLPSRVGSAVHRPPRTDVAPPRVQVPNGQSRSGSRTPGTSSPNRSASGAGTPAITPGSIKSKAKDTLSAVAPKDALSTAPPLP